MTPELWSAAWFSALMSIVLIDLVLAGDNAIVIGLAARNVPPDLQRRVILWGTAGAIIVRALLTGVVVWLLKIPGFLLVGGLALVYIGWKLTREEDKGHAIEAKASFRAAVQTIVVADAVMGVDNVLAVGGAAHGSWLLVIIGLVISIPIVVWGSSLVLKWVERYPVIIWIGAGVLGWTAAKMIATEPLLAGWLMAHPHFITVLEVVVVGGLVAAPAWHWLPHRHREQAVALIVMAVWLVGFGALEDRIGFVFHPFDQWGLADELVDLVRWVGWIPVVMLASRLVGRGRTTGDESDKRAA
jgi:YjbE family integral membrane protein